MSSAVMGLMSSVFHQVCVQARFDCRVPGFLAGIRVQGSRDRDDRPDPRA
jgi:hypothetical protein